VTGQQDYIGRTGNELWNQEVTDVSQGREMDQRERRIINCRGFKCTWFVQNALIGQPIFFNIALLAKKSLTVDGPIQETNFFRSHSVFRAVDFGAVTMTPFEKYTRAINPDDYTILWRKRFMLGCSSANSSNNQMGGMSSIKVITKYLKLNRAVTYANQESNSATDGQVSMVYWGSNAISGDGSLKTPTFNIAHRIVMYFKEPKQ